MLWLTVCFAFGIGSSLTKGMSFRMALVRYFSMKAWTEYGILSHDPLRMWLFFGWKNKTVKEICPFTTDRFAITR